MADFELSFSTGGLKKFLIFGFLLAVFVLELMLTFTHPIAFGDEGYHVSTARYIGTQVDYSQNTPLFGSIINPERFSRPPEWNLIEASFYFLFGFSDTIVKFLMPLISLLTGLVVYSFGRKLYSENLGIIAAAIAVTIPSFVTYSVLFYTTVPYIFFFSIAFFSLLTAMKTGGRKWWLLAGVFSGISIITNIAGLFMPILTAVMAVISVLWKRDRRSVMDAVKKYGAVLLITALIVAPWVARNVSLYYVPGCHSVMSIIQGNCQPAQSYQSSDSNQFAGTSSGGGTDQSVVNIGVTNYLQFAYGFFSQNSFLNFVGLIFVPFSFLAGLYMLAKRKELYDVSLLAAAVIFLLVFFFIGGFFEGRSEDTARYMLSAVPLIGLAAAGFWSGLRKDEHRMNGIIVLLVILVVLALSFFNFYNKLVQMDSVKNFVPSFFQACDWVKQNLPKDANLLSLQTYPTRYNCDRGAVWEIPDKADILLSNNVTLARDRLLANGIGYVFVQKFSLSQTPFGQSYPVSFVDMLEKNNQTFIKLYENGPAYGSQQFVSCVNGGGCDPGNIVFKVN